VRIHDRSPKGSKVLHHILVQTQSNRQQAHLRDEEDTVHIDGAAAAAAAAAEEKAAASGYNHTVNAPPTHLQPQLF
jgi:hypothetical protein